VKVSKNELIAALKKSFEGLGFQYGDYLDAANMVAWAQMHGLDGLGQLSLALPFLDKKPHSSRALEPAPSEFWVFDVEGDSILLCGSQIVDIACSVARQQSAVCVRVDNCHNRLFVIERLANAAQRGLATMACWSTSRTFEVVAFEVHARYPKVTSFVMDKRDAATRQSLFVFCGLATEDLQVMLESLIPDYWSEFGSGTELNGDFFRSAYNAALDGGIDMPTSLWSSFDRLTARVLVESTESSRAGAGE
jgi:hypothetical protein